MATGPKIVHKQFNSPMGLYSRQNIQETLNKHMQNLDNGTVGIDFSNPNTDKPANLANSAVLRMLEEEERSRMGYPRQKKVVWPPVPETNGYHSSQQQSPNYSAPSPQQQYQTQPPSQQQPHYHNQPQYQQQQQNQYQQPQYQQQQQQQYQQQQPQYQQQQQQYQQPQQQYQQPQQQYQQPQQQYQQPQQQSQPAFCEGRRQEACGLSKLVPFSSGVSASPAPPRQAPVSPGAAYRQPNQPNQPNGRWAPASGPGPLSPQGYGSQPNYQQQAYPQSQYSPQQQYSEPQYSEPQYSEPAYQPPQRQFEPPPSTITLRQQAPVHQIPPPVYTSQPAAASFKGGVNMRGDMKWPPQSVREAVAEENDARMRLAKGPACRPRKVNKDYSNFFAQHALNHNTRGYRAPPGTQHYEDHSGRSSY